LQILHTGRYGFLDSCVAPSSLTAPINFYRPKALTHGEILQTIEDFANCAKLAKMAGYDGVEIMGSEGYLINQFITKCTNKRLDEWGGTFENRIRFPLQIVKRVSEEIKKNLNDGETFLIIYRLSCLDLVENGSTFDEVIELGKKIEMEGAHIINTGIGWHEARVPTIGMMVPRAAFSWVTGKLKPHLKIPIITSNRINDPYIAENILREGIADMISMARPMLADENFVNKTAEGRPDEINTCIACNQACLDHVFQMKTASCMVNPRAGRETKLNYIASKNSKSVAVVGAGPAGMTVAYIAAMRGHHVTLFDENRKLGGQINYAVKIPGKQEFLETLRFYRVMLDKYKVVLKLGEFVNSEYLLSENFDSIVLATGVKPRKLELKGSDHKKVLSYLDVLNDECFVGNKVAIIGAGGIGIDLAHYLTSKTPFSNSISEYLNGYNILDSKKAFEIIKPKKREVTVFQRSTEKIGKKLGKTTGWAHIQSLKSNGVNLISGANYLKIDDEGLHYEINIKKENEIQKKLINVDNIIIAAGQEPKFELMEQLDRSGLEIHLVGGAKETKGLDAKTAISDGAELASKI